MEHIGENFIYNKSGYNFKQYGAKAERSSAETASKAGLCASEMRINMKHTLGSEEFNRLALSEYSKGTLLRDIQKILGGQGCYVDSAMISALAHESGLSRRLERGLKQHNLTDRVKRKYTRRVVSAGEQVAEMRDVEELMTSNISSVLKKKLLKDLVKNL